MKKISKTKIEWADYVWNPVWGCLNNCPYCYARRIARRFAGVIAKKEFEGIFNRRQAEMWAERLAFQLREFIPTWLEDSFKRQFPKKPSRIFVGSMSEIYFWEKMWVEDVLRIIEKYPQHTFMFLTKFPEVYSRYKFPKNCWLGVTVTNEKEGIKIIHLWGNATLEHEFNQLFVSFEPLLSEINYDLKGIDWIILGAQTNPYKPPRREWVENIVEEAKKHGIPVFLKPNLYRAYPDLPKLQEVPE